MHAVMCAFTMKNTIVFVALANALNNSTLELQNLDLIHIYFRRSANMR